MPTPIGFIDPEEHRPDWVVQAAKSDFRSDFEWINDKEATRVTEDPDNKGYTAPEIRDLARDWICAGEEIDCVPERREGYKDRRHFHYDIIVMNLKDFPRGLYIEMELKKTDDDEYPTVNLLNAHPSSPR